MSNKIRFLAKFTDSNGVGHTAIHAYDPSTGFVDMMKDYKFDNMKYPCTKLEQKSFHRK